MTKNFEVPKEINGYKIPAHIETKEQLEAHMRIVKGAMEDQKTKKIKKSK